MGSSQEETLTKNGKGSRFKLVEAAEEMPLEIVGKMEIVGSCTETKANKWMKRLRSFWL
jgi:hypothetical protein